MLDRLFYFLLRPLRRLMPSFDSPDRPFDGGEARLIVMRGMRLVHTIERLAVDENEGEAPLPFAPGTTARLDVRRFAGGDLVARFETGSGLTIDGHRIVLDADGDATATMVGKLRFDLVVYPGGSIPDAELLVAGRIDAADAITQPPEPVAP